MSKIVFKPIVNAVLCILAYAFLAALFYLELFDHSFLIAGFLVSALILQAHIVRGRKAETTSKAQHLLFLAASLSILLLLLVFHGLTIKRSGFFFLYLALASLPPFYHFCGYLRFIQVGEGTSLLRHVVGIMAVPFLAFLAHNSFSGTNQKTIYIIIIVAAYYFVIFSLLKIGVTVYKDRNLAKDFFRNPNNQKWITAVLMLVMPITGLLLNQHLYIVVSQYARQYVAYRRISENVGLFGDFSHPAFYCLTVLNAALLLIPPAKYHRFRLPMFYAKTMGYCFILYMAVVFLPVLPVGILTLFFIVGIYAFVPLLAFWWQGRMLLAEYRALRTDYRKPLVVAVALLGLLTLPMLLGSFFAYDKANFKKAQAYADEYNTNASAKVDIQALRRTLDIRSFYTGRTRVYGTRMNTYFSYKNIPLLSGAYKRIMYGGEELIWDFQNRLNMLFFNQGYAYNASPYGEDSFYDSEYGYYSTDLGTIDYYTEHKSIVYIEDISHSTSYDESIGAYRTWVDLTLANSWSEYNEYKTSFHLPDGVYVSDYYLDVFGEKKMGLLTDRRAALAVYRRIVLSRLDPGILHYIGTNQLELRVFPFDAYERRGTGFELLHKNSFDLVIDGHVLPIAAGARVSEMRLPHAVLLSADEIKNLPPLERALTYSFILDCSAGSDVDKLLRLIEDFCWENGISDGTVYLSTYRFSKIPLGDLATAKINQEGGFNLGLAMKDVLANADRTTPLILFVSEAADGRVLLPKGLYNHDAPESLYYYKLYENNAGRPELTAYDFANGVNNGPVAASVLQETASYHGHAVIRDGQDKLVLLDGAIPELTGNQYLDGMALAVEHRIHLKNGIRNPVSYIRKSFLAHTLTPSTAFIVVETEAQERELLAVQQRLLEEDSDGQEGRPLSEPNIVLVTVVAAVLMLSLLHRKQKQTLTTTLRQ